MSGKHAEPTPPKAGHERLPPEGAPRSLLDVMDSIPCPPGIEFEPQRLRDLPESAHVTEHIA